MTDALVRAVRARHAETRTVLAEARLRKIRANVGTCPVPSVAEDSVAARALQRVVHGGGRAGGKRLGGSSDTAAPKSRTNAAGAVAPVALDDCLPPPTGLAWVRVRTSLRTPEGCEAGYFVPYLGETDAHFKSSQSLAVDLSSTVNQGNEEDECGDDEVDGYEDISDVEGTAPSEDARPRIRCARPAWDRAAKRIVVRDFFEREAASETQHSRAVLAQSIAKALCIRIDLVYAYLENAKHREKMWAKHDREADLKAKLREDLVLTALGRYQDPPAVELASDSVTMLFCRQCYTFDCMQHGIEPCGPSVELLDVSRTDSMSAPEQKRIVESCERFAPGSCWFGRVRTDKPIVVASSAVPLPKGCNEIVESLLEHMGSDFCRIAEIVRTLDSSGATIRCVDVGAVVHALSASKSPLAAVARPKPPRAPSKKIARGIVPPEEINAMMGGRRLDYTPCNHDGPCTPNNEDCTCSATGVNCEKYCSCNHIRVSGERVHALGQCPRSFGGCSCKSAAACMTNACICFSTRRECDPDLCRSCGAGNAPDEARGCCNVGLRLGNHFRTIVGRSSVHGWGAYAAEHIPKNMLIGEYVGEVINQDEAERRGRVYDELNYSFLFNITERYAVDSTRLGNKLKYCNHSSSPNCEPRLMRVSGDVRVGIYSKRDIIPLEELFFDYGYNNGPAWAMRGKLGTSEDERANARVESKKRKRSMMKENPPVRTVAADNASLPRTRAQSKRNNLRSGNGPTARRTSGRLASHLAEATRNTQPGADARKLQRSSRRSAHIVDVDASDESSANDHLYAGGRVTTRRGTRSAYV